MFREPARFPQATCLRSCRGLRKDARLSDHAQGAVGGGDSVSAKSTAKKELRSQLPQARSEARSAFNDDRIYIEKCVEPPRHVEVQILADAYGHVMHLGSRGLLHSAPPPEAAGDRAGRPAEKRARRHAPDGHSGRPVKAGYVNAGTVEFLVDPCGTNRFWFMEASTPACRWNTP